MLTRDTLRQYIVFIIGGALSAVIDIGAMQLLLAWNVNTIIATTVGFFVGVVVNYYYHALYTFQATTNPRAFVRFLTVIGINYSLTIACVYVAVEWSDAPAIVGKLVSLPLISVNGYFLSRYWVFKL